MIAEFREERDERFCDARRKVISRFSGDDARAALFCVTNQIAPDSAAASRAIHCQEAKILSAGDGDAFEVAVDARMGLAFVSLAEALLLGDAHEVVRRVVGAPQQFLQPSQIAPGEIPNHRAIMASLSH